ncbi:hypothetical protein A9404_11430 [Halothiobacillus diazotrophicus]|uniref:Alkylhydroperoxidase n=1 Tax=Halothiobacillus diazotrophicus TaxID=1860122 RepID=A0A191ZJ85_9GAMM|nr:hypothetical protein [Halothiobacillus diazotrophicus]ANJ67907.1 hypothetical protein A9404_11430 [Halothiobacillus diazotrophicus]
MSLISTVPPEQATGALAESYDQLKERLGWVPNIMQLMSASPEQLRMNLEVLGYFFNHPTLSLPLLATTRMLVSQAHHCDYCVDFNAALLINRCEQTPEQVAATRQDPNQAILDPKDKAMLLFTLKSVKTPLAVNADDIAALKALGWTDRDIFDAVAHAARNVSADIIFNTFKVERDF